MSLIRKILHSSNKPSRSMEPFEKGSDNASEEALEILSRYMQAGSSMHSKTAADSISKLLPRNDPNSGYIRAFAQDCFDLAETGSWKDSSHLKLARLIEYLGRSDQFHVLDKKTGAIYRFQLLGEVMSDYHSYPDADQPGEFVNYNSFVAHLYELRVFEMDPSYALWAMRSALENDLTDKDKEIRSAFALGAAQWILWSGQSLFELIS